MIVALCELRLAKMVSRVSSADGSKIQFQQRVRTQISLGQLVHVMQSIEELEWCTRNGTTTTVQQQWRYNNGDAAMELQQWSYSNGVTAMEIIELDGINVVSRVSMIRSTLSRLPDFRAAIYVAK